MRGAGVGTHLERAALAPPIGSKLSRALLEERLRAALPRFRHTHIHHTHTHAPHTPHKRNAMYTAADLAHTALTCVHYTRGDAAAKLLAHASLLPVLVVVWQASRAYCGR